jgi:hypothetical protein
MENSLLLRIVYIWKVIEIIEDLSAPIALKKEYVFAGPSPP